MGLENVNKSEIEYGEWEYICETERGIDIQKHLNQWKHTYQIEIISMSLNSSDIATHNPYVTILLKRRKL